MPYTINNPPFFLKNQPKDLIAVFVKVFNDVYFKTSDDEKARFAGWSAVKKRFIKIKGKWVKKREKNMNEGILEKNRLAQKVRSKKYKIGIKEGGHVTKPSEYKDCPDNQFADPVNYAYPLNTRERTLAAARYWGKPKNKAVYTPQEQEIITKRIERAKKRYKIGEYHEEKQLSVDWPERRSEAVYNAVQKDKRFGKYPFVYYQSDKYLFVKNEEGDFFRAEYEIDKNNNVKIGEIIKGKLKSSLIGKKIAEEVVKILKSRL